ncbi:MAG: glycerophosphodiester phosphodiesterase family protein [Bacteroidota bacterium]
MTRFLLLVALVLGVSAWLVWEGGESAPPSNGFVFHRVAHAGGGLDGQTYTNSMEALDQSAARGFVYIELDLLFTTDGELVCLHDWDDFGGEALSYDQFRTAVEARGTFDNCDLERLRTWMTTHTQVHLVTDVKGDNLDALALIRARIPEATRRVIPQVYHPEAFAEAKRLGFEQVIWTLYRYDGSVEDVIAWTERFEGPFAVTMPKARARTNLPQALAQRGVPTYVHTVNGADEAETYRTEADITEVYTDFLPPHSPAEAQSP